MTLWTPTHVQTLLPAIIVMLVIALVLRKTLGKKDRKIRMIPFQFFSCVLVLLEIGKQAISFKNGYDLYHIPLHFCSLFIFALPAMAFYRGKHANQVKTVTTTLCMAVTGLMLIFPNIIYSPGNVDGFFKSYLDFHTVAFHNLVICAFVLIMGLKVYAPEETGEKKAVLLAIVGFCAVAASAAHILKVNFANFYSCNVGPLDAVRISLQSVLGVFLTQVLYVSIIASLHIGFVWGCYQLLRTVRKRISKAEKAAV